MKSELNPGLRYEKALGECNKHLHYLNLAFKNMEVVFPLTLEKFNRLSVTEVAFLDQIVFRFTKLQDTIGNKLILHGLALLNEPVEEMTMLDKLHLLEKLKVLKNTNEWLELRELRNELTHEYPEDEQIKIDALNLLKIKKDILQNTLLAFSTLINKKI